MEFPYYMLTGCILVLHQHTVTVMVAWWHGGMVSANRGLLFGFRYVRFDLSLVFTRSSGASNPNVFLAYDIRIAILQLDTHREREREADRSNRMILVLI